MFESLCLLYQPGCAFTACTQEVYTYEFSPAKYEISSNSLLRPTVSSPISHIISDYKNLREAQERRSQADAWNTRAHLITTYKPSGTNNSIPEWKGFNFGCNDVDVRVPAADGSYGGVTSSCSNLVNSLFDVNGETEVQGR